MLEGKIEYSFKDAVFYTENAFLDNNLNPSDFNKKIKKLVFLIDSYSLSNKESFRYNYDDKNTQLKRASLFKIMTDTIFIQYKMT
jgi:hypothetical protein